MAIHILGISGSPRHGATEACVREALRVAGEVVDVQTTFISLAGKTIHNCIHCDRCLREGNGICPVFDDDANGFLPLVEEADGFIIGTPVYSMNTAGILQNFLNRFRPIGVNIRGSKKFIRVCGSIATSGMLKGGTETALNGINNFGLVSGMAVVSGGVAAYNGASVWSNNNKAAGITDDPNGMLSVRVIGRRVAVMTKILVRGYESLRGEIPDHLLAGFETEEEVADFYQSFVSLSD